MTPQEIAARLPELTGGPHDDDLTRPTADSTSGPLGPSRLIRWNGADGYLVSAAGRDA